MGAVAMMAVMAMMTAVTAMMMAVMVMMMAVMVMMMAVMVPMVPSVSALPVRIGVVATIARATIAIAIPVIAI